MRRRAVIQISALALVICLTSALTPLAVGALDVVYDAENGWQGFQLDEHLVFTQSTGDIRLRPAGNRTGAQLFVGFEPTAPNDDADTQPPPYQPVSPGTYLPGRPQVGERSGLFTTQTAPLVLRPLPGSVLSPQFTNQSFTIQMWVNPNHSNSGRILSWESRNIPTPFPAQRLYFAHSGDAFTWTLGGLFYNERTGAAQDVRLDTAKIPPGGAATVESPGVWQHHHLQYIHNEARVTYRVDGQVADTVAVTAGNFPAHWRVDPRSAGDLHIGGGGASVGGFSGRIDHLLVHAGETKPVLQRYPLRAGEVRSEILDLGQTAAGALQRITIESAQSSHTETLVWYRFSQQTSQFGDDDTALPWLPVTSGAGIVPAPLGRYVQLRAKLYPDGPGNFSPTLSSITLSVDPVRPALPALSPEATAADEVLTVSWDPAPELRTIHYRVLYGTDPGVYPFVVDVQDGLQTTLAQLENEQVYYISIESYLPGFPSLPGGRTEPIIGRVFLEAGNQ